MSTYTYEYETQVEVTEKISADIRVEYTVGPDYPGSYFEPGEIGEVEVIDVDFFWLFGETWSKTYEQLRDSGWLEFLVRTRAWNSMCEDVDHYDLYCHARD